MSRSSSGKSLIPIAYPIFPPTQCLYLRLQTLHIWSVSVETSEHAQFLSLAVLGGAFPTPFQHLTSQPGSRETESLG